MSTRPTREVPAARNSPLPFEERASLRGGRIPGSARGAHVALALGLAWLAVGCRQDMHDQPRYKPLAESRFFDDGRSARPLVPGTVARGRLAHDPVVHTGRDDAGFVADVPRPIDRALLERGRERYDIFCSPCHARTGRGDGMVVRRGLRRPPSLHIERLREARAGYLFDVITRGFGAMPDYAAQIPVQDRWAVVAYLRVLQLSQNARLSDVPAQQRAQLEPRP